MEILSMLFLMMSACGMIETYNLQNDRASGVFSDDYDKYEPPYIKGKPADVYVQLNVLDIDKIYDGAMEFSVQCYLVELWTDYRLNLTKFKKDKEIHIFPTYLMEDTWAPDLVFDNTRNGMLFHLSIPNTSVKVLKDGTFLKSSRYNLLVGCQMDFKLYPMDTQECFLKIATMSNPDFKVLLHWAEEYTNDKMSSINLMSNIQPLMYVLREPESYKDTEIWTSGNYTYLYANFTFVRRLSGSVFNVYVPSTLVVFLSWISFWLDVEAVPARVTLGVTSLLTLATQVAQAHAALPAISYMTAIDVWLFACLITVFSSLIEFAFSYQLFVTGKLLSTSCTCGLMQREKSTKEIRILRPRGSSIVSSGLVREKTSTENPGKTPKTSQKHLDNISRKMFPILFLIFVVFYWTYYLHFM